MAWMFLAPFFGSISVKTTNPRCHLNNSFGDGSLSREIRASLPRMLSLCVGFLAAACNQSKPLSINMIHPITKEFRTCAAREANPKNSEALAATVELCARHLETRGYIRDDS